MFRNNDSDNIFRAQSKVCDGDLELDQKITFKGYLKLNFEISNENPYCLLRNRKEHDILCSNICLLDRSKFELGSYQGQLRKCAFSGEMFQMKVSRFRSVCDLDLDR